MSLKGITYRERISTFTAVWPWTKSHSCSPEKLARAGFILSSGPPTLEIKCICCKGRITNLTPNLEPWEIHAKMNPRCPIIQMGKPEEPDGYTLSQVLRIAEHAAIAEQYEGFNHLNAEVKTMLTSLN